MQYRFEPLLFVALITAGLLSVISCSKPSDLGLSLVEVNPSDLFFTDTLSIEMNTVTTSPLQTNNRSRWLCGAYIDPIFGKSNSKIYANFRLTTTNATFPSSTFDSIVLSLQYDTIGHYGGNVSDFGPQTWEVYRMTETMVPEQEYFSDQEFDLGDLLATHIFTPAIFDSVEVDGLMQRPHLRIKLDDALGQELLNPSDNIYENNTIFKEFLKGFCIKPKENVSNSAIIRFLPSAPFTKLTMFYKDDQGVQRSYEFLSDTDVESVVSIEQDYSGTPVLQNNSNDTIVYIQGLNGVGVKLEFPFLDSLGEIIVNKAELYVYAAGEDDREYPIPNQLFCLEKTSAGDYLLVDDITNSISRNSLNPYLIFGGTVKYEGDRPYFRMNLSTYFQRLVDDETDEKSVYLQTASVTDAQRMLIANQRSSALKAKLYLTYTKIN